MFPPKGETGGHTHQSKKGEKRMKKTWKRLLAGVLTASMVLSMAQIATFATEGTTETKLPPVTVASQNENGVTVNGADGTSITGKKTIAKVDGTDDQFDITLEVTTKSKMMKMVKAHSL